MENGEENAFPIVLQHGLTSDSHVEVGLTKREYISALAMKGLLTRQPVNAIRTELGVSECQRIATESIIMADALLKALEETNEQI